MNDDDVGDNERLLSANGTIAVQANGCLRCYFLSAGAQCFSGRVETQNPVLRTDVKLLHAFVDICFFSWAAQYASPLRHSGRAFGVLLEELAYHLRLHIILHTRTRPLGEGSQNEGQCREVCLESRCYSHTVAFFRAPKLLGVLDAFWRILPCKVSRRCEKKLP